VAAHGELSRPAETPVPNLADLGDSDSICVQQLKRRFGRRAAGTEKRDSQSNLLTENRSELLRPTECGCLARLPNKNAGPRSRLNIFQSIAY
jgi:hypothetical protein